MVPQEINVQDIRDKLYNKLKPSGWAEKLRGFILSSDFEKIINTLHKETLEGKRFTPVLKQVFRCFEECPYRELKVIFIGQDPYPQPPIIPGGLPVADGITFSCSNTLKPEASLRYIFKELEDTIYHEGYTWDPDLKRWSNQGILLINTALTTHLGQVGAHYSLWQPFISYVFDMITTSCSGLIYVFIGRQAEMWAKSIPSNNYKITVVHPAAAAYKKSEKWDSDNLFNKINNILLKSNNLKIIW